MRDFDHDAVYYRVIGEDSGYLYRSGELEEMTHGQGRLVADARGERQIERCIFRG